MTACAVFFFLMVGLSPASAAPCPGGTPIDLLNTLCVTNGTVQVQDQNGHVVTSVTVPAPAPVTITTPGPTRTVTAAPQTVTRTVIAAPTTVRATVTAPPTTVTQTVTETKTITTGQERSASATVSRTPASLATPPAESGSSINLVPKRPGSALAEGTLIGIILGALAALFIAYLRGKRVGEKETLQESLDIVRGEGPKTGRHRVN